MPENFWLLFIANLPIVTALFVAQHRGWIVMGVTHNKEIENKDKEIEFREQLRQEALKDRALLEAKDKEKTEALRALTEVVKQTLVLNDRLLSETLDNRWDGNDRRDTQDTSRARGRS